MLRAVSRSGKIHVGLALLSVSAFVAACGLDREGLLEPDSGVGGGTGGAIPVGGGGAPSGGGGGSAGTSVSGGGSDGDSGGPAGAGGVSSCAAGRVCVPTAPAGWDYVYLKGSAFAEPEPAAEACVDQSTPKRFLFDPAGPAKCAPCACGALTGAACTIPLLCTKADSCSAPSDYSKNDSDCHSDGATKLACALGTPNISATGTCPPSGGELLDLQPFRQIADLCYAAPEGSCGSSSTCVPRGGGSYDAFVCVGKTGELTCPQGYNDVETAVYKSPLDTRACSACGCAAGTVTCQGTSYRFYDTVICSGSNKLVDSTACTNLSGLTDNFGLGYSYERKSQATAQGSCAPTGGVGSGTAAGDPNTAFTVCCRHAGS